MTNRSRSKTDLLIAVAKKYAVGHVALDALEDRVNSPHWDETFSVIRQWESYIPTELRALWGDLSMEEKLIAFVVASSEVSIALESMD